VTEEYRPENGQQALASVMRPLPREAQLRLQYYERFGDFLQQQIAALAAHAASVSREVEREQAEASARLLHSQQETAALQDEVARLNREIEALRAESAAVRDETVREQEMAGDRITRLRDEAEQLEAERDRAQADLNRAIQELKREQAALGVQNLRLREEVRSAEGELGQIRAEADALVQEVERIRRERVPLASEVARLRQEVESLQQQCARRREEAAAIIAQAQSEAASILADIRKGGEPGPLIAPSAWDTEGRSDVGYETDTPVGSGGIGYGSASPTIDGTSGVGLGYSDAPDGARDAREQGSTTTKVKILVDDPRSRDHAVESLATIPGVIRVEPDASTSDILVVTHPSGRSLVGLMLAADDLRFEIVNRSEDLLEIRLLSASDD